MVSRRTPETPLRGRSRTDRQGRSAGKGTMSRPTSRLRTLVGPRQTASSSPWKSSVVPQPAREEPEEPSDVPSNSPTPPTVSDPVMLSAETDLGVLMHALLGTAGSSDAVRNRRATDVESRLAEVLADVGLVIPEPGRPASTPNATSRPDRRGPYAAGAMRPLTPVASEWRSVRVAPPRPMAGALSEWATPGQSARSVGLRRLLWVAVPALLAMLIGGTWLTSSHGESKRPAPSAVSDPLLLSR